MASPPPGIKHGGELLLGLSQHHLPVRFNSPSLISSYPIDSNTKFCLSLPRPLVDCLTSVHSPEVRLVVTTTALLFVHLYWPQAVPADRTSPTDATRESYASLLGQLNFAWVDQFLITAWLRNTLTVDQIPTLNQVETPNYNARAFEQSNHNQKGLLWRLLSHFRAAYIEQTLWAVMHGLSSFVPVLLLQSIMHTMEHTTDTPIDEVWVSIALLFPSSVLAAMAECKCIWLAQKIGFRLRAIMVSEIYAKALKRSTTNESTADQRD